MSIELIPGFGAFTPASGAGSYLLDDLGVSAAVAYSTRKLRSAYAGSVIRVRRSSDDAEQDIGFSGDELDTASIASFVSSNSAYVTKWYDQSGNGNDASVGTASLQPRIVNAGTIETLGGKSAIYFIVASQQYLLHSDISTAGGSMSVSAVCEGTGGGATNRAICGGQGGAFEVRISSSDKVEILRQEQIGLITTTASVGAGANCIIAVSTTSSEVVNLNGSEESNTTSPSFSAANKTIGNFNTGGSEAFDGHIGEVVIFQSALTGGNRSTIEANVSAYWGTP